MSKQEVILCSEDTRIHLETRTFASNLSSRGCEVTIRGKRDDAALKEADLIEHFGHGSPAVLANRFGEIFVDAAAMPDLPRHTLVFADGCGTLPVRSPLLQAFFDHGAIGYCGSTETVQGMIPARFTNELVEHFLAAIEANSQLTIPRGLMRARGQARARYVHQWCGPTCQRGSPALVGLQQAPVPGGTGYPVRGRKRPAGSGPAGPPGGRRLGGGAATQGLGTDGTHQVGYGAPQNGTHAVLWSGTAASFVDLHPSGYLESYAYAVGGNQQVGRIGMLGPEGSEIYHASLWTGTAASVVDLQPGGPYTESGAVATDGIQQVGYGVTDWFTDRIHPLLWSGTAASAIDLTPNGYVDAAVFDTRYHMQVGGTLGSAQDATVHATLWFSDPN